MKTARTPSAVDFFIIGVQKGGTSALASYLGQHPSIQMCRIKEAHHFDDEALDWSDPDHERLHAQFDWAEDGMLRGEATPIYIYWPQALARLRRYNPRAKLILVLRHPAFRAFSHWNMECARLSDDMPFEEAISERGRARVEQSPSGVHRVFSYVERGFYARQAEALLGLFPRDQLHVLRTDHLWNDPGGCLAMIEEFLDLESRLHAVRKRRYVSPVASSARVGLTERSKSKLHAIYRDDIRRTSDLIQLDLSDWLRPDYCEPMTIRSD